MFSQHTPSIDLALSLASQIPLARDSRDDALDTPSALPDPTETERHETRDEHLGIVEEVVQRFDLGQGVSLLVQWLGDSDTTSEIPRHVRQVELSVDETRLTLRRGQLRVLTRALGLADYVFETAEREELARRTC